MKNRDYLFLILFLSILPFIPMLLNPLHPHTQDGLVHLARMGAYFKALAGGQILPRWAADLNYGYGMPLFIFMYPLPYFLTSLFIFFGASLVLAFKLIVVLSFLLSGLFMFLFVKEFFKEEKIAFFVTLFYQFAPFRLVEANIRGDIGEIYTYAFLPLILFGLFRFFKKEKMIDFLLASLAATLLIISHNSISLVFFAISLGFILFFAKNLRQVILGIIALLTGIATSAFYWLPALFEHKFTYGDLFMRDLYKEYFTPISKLALPNFFNSSSLNMGDVPVQIGIFHLGLMLLSLVTIFKVKKLPVTFKKVIFFSWILFLATIFFTQPVSALFWEKFSWLRQFQFPWRFLAAGVFASTLTSVSFFAFPKIVKSNFLYGLILILMVTSTIFYWRTPFGFEKINEQDYWNFPQTTTYYGETDIIWSGGPVKEYPPKRVELIAGEGQVIDFERGQVEHKFKVLAQTPVNVVDRTQFFPGWRVFAQGQEIPIQFQDPNHRGLITFQLPKGEHEVSVKFGRTKDRLISEIISLGGLIVLLILGIIHLISRKLSRQSFKI